MKYGILLIVLLCGCRSLDKKIIQMSGNATPVASFSSQSVVALPPLFHRSITWESWNDITSFPAECDIEIKTDIMASWKLQARVMQTNYESAVMNYSWDSTNETEFVRIGTHWKLE